LHKKVLKITNKNSIVAFASCTHYVDYPVFVETIQIAARQEGRAIQILEQGMQGWDHPVRTLNDKANYIKYVLVRVE
jgi:23S rRNA (cytosine1962-C5)-methyltransferase